MRVAQYRSMALAKQLLHCESLASPPAFKTPQVVVPLVTVAWCNYSPDVATFASRWRRHKCSGLLLLILRCKRTMPASVAQALCMMP